MDNQNLNVKEYDDEINLKELLSVLWESKNRIVLIISIFAICSVIYALSIPNQYKATATMIAAQQGGGGVSGALGQLGGLASLAGVNIGGGDTSEAQIAQEIMQSRSFVEDFIKKHDISVEVFAVKGWSKSSDELVIDDNIYDVSKKEWLLKNSANSESGAPSGWSLYKKFSRMLNVSSDMTSGIVTISIEYFSPNIAKEWLDKYIVAINQFMQSRQIGKVTRNIEFLSGQINKTSIAEMQGVLYTIIEEQIKSKMLAEASPDYVFVTVSPAMVPEEKSGPKRALICVLGLLLGGIFSITMVLIMHFKDRLDA